MAAPSAKLLVHRRQRGNPVLKEVRNVPVEFVDGIVPDFVVGAQACALFLSVRYHLLHPRYAVGRVRELGRSFDLRVLLCLVDVLDSEAPLRELNTMAALNGCSLLLAWSTREAARYLETLKAYEHKPADTIQGRVDEDYLSMLTDALTRVKSVNKTDAQTLATTFGSLHGVLEASERELRSCPGFGMKKARRLMAVLDQPLLEDLAGPGDEVKAGKTSLLKAAGDRGAPVSATGEAPADDEVAVVDGPAESSLRSPGVGASAGKATKHEGTDGMSSNSDLLPSVLGTQGMQDFAPERLPDASRPPADQDAD